MKVQNYGFSDIDGKPLCVSQCGFFWLPLGAVQFGGKTMLLNVSYNNKVITKKVDEAVGKPFTLKERWALGGIGSPKLFITGASVEIRNLLILDNNLDCCNVELRPRGIIVRFRSLLETFALVIPYYKLSLYKGDSAVYSIYKDHHFIKVRSDTEAIRKFFKKLLNHKTDNAPTAIEDL